MFEIEILTKKGFKNSHGKHMLSYIFELGIKDITKVEYSPLYLIYGDISSAEAETLASELLSDKIIEDYVVNRHCDLSFEIVNSDEPSLGSSVSIIEVWYKKGVTDVVAESVVKAVKDLGIDKDVKVKAGHKYYLYGQTSQTVLNCIATKLIANTLVQEYKIK
jgi:phosphoribosylformylglycinamidine synthase